MDYITRKKIATAFHTAVIQRDFTHTSVTTIMDLACMRRQTFYDYFQDKYELLVWFVADSLGETIEANFGYLPWREIVQLTMFELDAQRPFYASVMRDQQEVDLVDLFAAHLQDLVQHYSTSWTQNTTSQRHVTELVVLGISYRIMRNLTAVNPIDYEIIGADAIKSLAEIIDQPHP
ncbi:dihydroxyacetone kinase transcriptional activator DhaS [Lacticaseibacillus nasuensis]|jgi:probable dihydroxyacetone kinase regulator|uniref:dihydroxyacetone kinase transcriptional activator DhaS n=1 Tax=Lacticaseibacillus nasuensis TaxID=944671 RepID=UPI0022476AC5|nr:dihydroxyacetone kinase transcriptional activator DhaS [Lacticaseibacillus nasuensis]MCX2455288.1 dihydroxyacetone kinase transcriptional activator DhaS [Lacticaseibacillus nasuensis]